MLNIITNGYILPFISKPNLARTPLILSIYKALQKDQTLASCIQSLLSKNAIERVENVKSLGFYSRLFLVPKPHQRWRPVIDLSRLNTFLLVERFKMETPESIRTSLIPGKWVSSIDLPSPVNRMVTASTGVQTDLSKVDHSLCRSICHSSEPQSSTVRISSPRLKCLGHRCSEHKLAGSQCLCLPSHGSPSQVIQKIWQSSCLIIVIAQGWPGMPWFCDHFNYQCQELFSNSPTTMFFTAIHNISTSTPGV